MKWAFAVSLLSVFLAACSSNNGGSSHGIEAANSPEKISAGDLMQAFKNHLTNADQLYKGRTLLVTGILQNRTRGLYGTSLDIMTDENPYRWVVCESTEQTWVEEADKAQLGRQVAFIGTYNSFEADSNKVRKVKLLDCRLTTQ